VKSYPTIVVPIVVFALNMAWKTVFVVGYTPVFMKLAVDVLEEVCTQSTRDGEGVGGIGPDGGYNRLVPK
jgi:hypothetical protein